jgi:hypothetical protein
MKSSLLSKEKRTDFLIIRSPKIVILTTKEFSYLYGSRREKRKIKSREICYNKNRKANRLNMLFRDRRNFLSEEGELFMIKAYIDIQSFLMEAERNFHYFDFADLCKQLREKHGVEKFFFVGNYRNRLVKLVVAYAQAHETHFNAQELDSYIEYDKYGYDEGTLITELAKDFFCQDQLNDNEYIVATNSSASLSMIYFMLQNSGNLKVLMPKNHLGYEKIAKVFPMIEDIDLAIDKISLLDKICIKELRDMLTWAEERQMNPTRMVIINQLQKFSRIDPAMTSFFLNTFVKKQYLREDKHEGEGEDGRTYFSVHIVNRDALTKLVGDGDEDD